MTYAMRVPCLNCEDRHIGCHSGCSSYIAWKREWDKAKQEADKRQQGAREYAAYKGRLKF